MLNPYRSYGDQHYLLGAILGFFVVILTPFEQRLGDLVPETLLIQEATSQTQETFTSKSRANESKTGRSGAIATQPRQSSQKFFEKQCPLPLRND